MQEREMQDHRWLRMTPGAMLEACLEVNEESRAPVEWKSHYPSQCPSDRPYWIKRRLYFQESTG
jgi:hypothetical protein